MGTLAAASGGEETWCHSPRLMVNGTRRWVSQRPRTMGSHLATSGMPDTSAHIDPLVSVDWGSSDKQAWREQEGRRILSARPGPPCADSRTLGGGGGHPCSTQWATTGPLRRFVDLLVRTGHPEGQPCSPCSAISLFACAQGIGPLRRLVESSVRPGDPAPSGPPLGPLRRTVERSGGPGKGRNPQNRGGQNQGRRRGHRAA